MQMYGDRLLVLEEISLKALDEMLQVWKNIGNQVMQTAQFLTDLFWEGQQPEGALDYFQTWYNRILYIRGASCIWDLSYMDITKSWDAENCALALSICMM